MGCLDMTKRPRPLVEEAGASSSCSLIGLALVHNVGNLGVTEPTPLKECHPAAATDGTVKRGIGVAEHMRAFVNFATDHGSIAATTEAMTRARSLAHSSSSSSSSSVIHRSTNLK